MATEATGTTETSARGRPRTFDEELVVEQVMALFWERGFEAASMAEVVEAAGLNKSSLYNAFGSKDELFRRALDRYLDMRHSMLDEFTDGDRGIDDLLGFVELIRIESLGEGGGRGCLGVNTSAELGNQDPWVADFSVRYRSIMRGAFRRVLQRAADLGEIDSGLVETYVDTMMALAMSTALTARSGANADELNRQIDSIAALVESWRTDG
ncbi:MAG: TetR/AcrR family transcriptional regulator [Ilumatobacter sp.]|uniref:TetR/AcrR family transcriptional regulator n=1 Tax=Ilumatobacter sp. TaxID=1967498 RepID=UPI002628FCCD|nr:TetR/AcrR family transcriptional regulator [Ilumatobacter sp.]MDJ0769616.1 TetR/AcrR family transcriptional regulator [Ilumatobacter sp.]